MRTTSKQKFLLDRICTTHPLPIQMMHRCCTITFGIVLPHYVIMAVNIGAILCQGAKFLQLYLV